VRREKGNETQSEDDSIGKLFFNQEKIFNERKEASASIIFLSLSFLGAYL